MNRRSVVRAVGVGALAGTAGCFSRDEEEDEDDGDEEATDATERDDTEPDDPDLEGTFRVATTESMVVGERAVGEWIKEAFEEEFPDAELQWTIPEAGLDHYRRRVDQGAEIDADVYLGLTPSDLARLDADLAANALFRELGGDRLPATERIRDDLEFGDPSGRAVPAGVRYSCLWYDESELEEPDDLADLLDDEYEDSLLVPRADRSDAGLAFLLWTIETVGDDGYRRYWGDLEENGLELVNDWTASTTAFADGDRPLAVGYSTDAAFAEREGLETDDWELAFPNGQGYETPVGAAIFEDAEEVDLAYDFLNFLLSSDVQAEFAERHSVIPALSRAFLELDETFEESAAVPSEPVSVGYDRLRSDLERWVDEWAETLAE
ncbi:extracellular solute-binding protein [Natronococcus sp. A-GB7]|uniref:thiamine ABC transporter substrate-binding protein n=1 Tax=Natronococcus sp. A-GB7 TaxID=3037649 RepID=UPI00241EF5CD|nr:extracellular solute-binding protein [Natronococcus sp. A-GB7]MDG5817942.1 extracellular solute-binding protein [Natronococcus sp. A-GB7]